MYLDDIGARIRAQVPDSRIPEGHVENLFRIYAVLLRAKGKSVTQSDVHDAWAAWMVTRNEPSESLIPYDELPENVRDLDKVYVEAIQTAYKEVGGNAAPNSAFFNVLFPNGTNVDKESAGQLMELYKLMVASSEGLVSRRLGVNTFFLTMNGALLTASGLIAQSASQAKIGAMGVAVLAIAGLILCGAWKSLITSFGQLNTGKFRVIGEIERFFPAAIYAGEWEALDRGENPKVYRSFTSREVWVPLALMALHFATACCAIAVSLGWIAVSRDQGFWKGLSACLFPGS